MRGDGGEPVARVVRRMAEREAAAHLLHPRLAAFVEAPPAQIVVRVEPCPWCGRRSAAVTPAAGLVPVREVRLLADGGTATPSLLAEAGTATEGAVTLSALACESLTARSLVILARGAGLGSGLPSTSFVTRSVAWARLLEHAGREPLPERIALLDASEAWADAVVGTRPAGPLADGSARPTLPYTLPASTRCDPGVPLGQCAVLSGQGATGARREALRRQLAPHFITPHLAGVPLDRLNRDYLWWRLSSVARALGAPPTGDGVRT